MLRNAAAFSPVRGSWVIMPTVSLAFAASQMVAGQMPGQKAPGPPPAQIEQTSRGFRATAGKEVLTVTACTDEVIHVVATPDTSSPASPRPWMLDQQQSCPGAHFTFSQDAKAATIKTAEVIVNVKRGNLSLRTANGESLLNEGRGARPY